MRLIVLAELAIGASACSAPGGASSEGATRGSQAGASGGSQPGASGESQPGAASGSQPNVGDRLSEGGSSEAIVPDASCLMAGPGMSNCGPSAESCCTSLPVAGGTYFRTYASTADGGVIIGQPATDAGGGAAADSGVVSGDPATVSGFRLDKYLVTVGRFRQFAGAWNGGAGWFPPAASGKHAHLNGGNGLGMAGGSYESGWLATDNVRIAPTNENLACDASFATWTASAGSQESLPINCVNWWEAYAFCIWDGGFLPTETEWEYAAAGGSQQREYPWGSTSPGTSDGYAIYGCHPSDAGACAGLSNIAAVGTTTQGAGLWGQLDLAGDVWEQNLDWYSSAYVDPCTDCANLMAASARVLRGGYFGSTTSDLSPAHRNSGAPTDRFSGSGFRCARTP